MHIASNELTRILAAWREAERDLRDLEPGTEGRRVAAAAADRLRTVYRDAQARAVAADAPREGEHRSLVGSF